MAIWIQPPRGPLLNGTRPWRRGDRVSLDVLAQTTNRVSLTMRGELPPGLFFSEEAGGVRGTIQLYPRENTRYDVIFRATYQGGKVADRAVSWIMDGTDQEQSWNAVEEDFIESEKPAMLHLRDDQGLVGGTLIQVNGSLLFRSGVNAVNLGDFRRGEHLSIQLPIQESDGDALTYDVVPATPPPGGHGGLPQGLKVDQWGRIQGTPAVTNPTGPYLFHVRARDSQDLATRPRGEGIPLTGRTLFNIYLSQSIAGKVGLSDQLTWLTPEGLLDEVWEGQPSQLSVAAQALYDAPDELPERQIIQYTLVEPFRTMPAGLLLDRDTGMILGTMPRVSADQTFAFSVEARVVFLDQLGTRRVSEISQTRTFRVKVRRFYDHPGAIDILVPASGQLTNYLTRWIWGDGRSSDATPVIKDSEVWRVRDPQAGRSSEFHLALVSGLLDLTDEALAVKLRDYHGGGSLRPATLGSRKVLDGLGRHTHDAVFMTLTDPLEGAGGFRDGLEVLVDRYEPNQAAQALPQWNLQAADRHLFPASLENARRDLIQTEERLAWTENLESADQRGVGLSGPSESWPRWMMGQWRCEILLLHAQPNLGPTLVGRLERAGLMSQLPSQTMSRTRYLVRRRQHQQTTWDGGLTTWDGPTSVDSPTASQTVFDETTLTDDKYQRV